MGGIVCNIHAQTTLRYQTIPTSPQDLKEFDAQMRQLFNLVAQDVVNDKPSDGMVVCNIMRKADWTLEDRTTLLNIIESLYPPYP